jgi:DNA repair exonuclease SbcCD ATPase subunit
MKKFIIVVLAVAVSMFGASANALTPQEEADVREAQEVLHMVKEENAQIAKEDAKEEKLRTERVAKLQEVLKRLRSANTSFLENVDKNYERRKEVKELLHATQ